MSNIVREDRDALVATLTVTIEQADYSPDYEKQLNKYRREAQIKGFRQGKTPLAVVKKMFGRPLLMDLVNKQLEASLQEYLEAADFKILGQAIPSEDQPDIEFDPRNPSDYTFIFDVGISPEFEIVGLDAGTVYETYAPIITDEMVQEQWSKILEQSKERVDKEHVEAGAMLSLIALQMADGEVKEDGIDTEFSLLWEDTSDEIRALLEGKSVGDTILIDDIYSIEPKQTPQHINKYLLGLSETAEEGEDPRVEGPFQLSIKGIKVMDTPTIDEAFLQKIFGADEVTNEQEAFDFIKKALANSFEKQSDALFFTNVKERLTELNPIPLPDAFIKRSLSFSNEKNTPEVIEASYPNFAKGQRWALIFQKLLELYNVEITAEDLEKSFLQDVNNMYGAYSQWMTDEIANMLVKRMMEDKEAVEKKSYEVMTDKMIASMKEVLTTTVHQVDLASFNQIMNETFSRVEQEEEDALAFLDDEEE